jgi:hypothetical protein
MKFSEYLILLGVVAVFVIVTVYGSDIIGGRPSAGVQQTNKESVL